MTREERENAIKWFENRKKMHIDDQCQRAEDTALEALRAEPCEDAVSRKAVLEDIKSELWDSGMNMGGEYQGVWVRYKDIEKIINKHISGGEQK